MGRSIFISVERIVSYSRVYVPGGLTSTEDSIIVVVRMVEQHEDISLVHVYFEVLKAPRTIQFRARYDEKLYFTACINDDFNAPIL